MPLAKEARLVATRGRAFSVVLLDEFGYLTSGTKKTLTWGAQLATFIDGFIMVLGVHILAHLRVLGSVW